MSIRYKLIVWSLITLIVPVAILTSLFVGGYNVAVERRLSSLSGQIVQQAGYDLNYRLEVIGNLMTATINNESVLDILILDEEQNALNEVTNGNILAKHFGSLIYSNRYIESIVIHRTGKPTLIFGPGSYAGNETSYRKFFRSPSSCPEALLFEQQVQQATGDLVWRNNLGSNLNDEYLYAGRQFSHFQSMKVVGSIYFIIKNSVLTDINAVTQEDYSFVLDEEGVPVVGELPQDRSIVDFVKQTLPASATLVGEPMGKSILSYVTISNQWVYVSGVSLDTLMSDISAVWNQMRVAMVLLIFVGISLAVVFANSVTKRLQLLVDKALRVESGILTPPSYADPVQDEIGRLDFHFNKMVVQLSQLIQTNYIHQIEKKQAQLDVLQYQINPHFFYNTLEVINSIAAVEHQTEIREICKRLGLIFRYNLSSAKGDDTVELQDELSHLQNYIYLQKLHSSPRFDVFYDVDPQVKHQRVIRFILQPIVENCIKHGFYSTVQAHIIEISALLEEDKLVVRIADDGVGIATERLLELQQMLCADSSNLNLIKYRLGIGLHNVHARIRLMYGDLYGASITDNPPHGTIVTLTMPGHAGEKEEIR